MPCNIRREGNPLEGDRTRCRRWGAGRAGREAGRAGKGQEARGAREERLGVISLWRRAVGIRMGLPATAAMRRCWHGGAHTAKPQLV